MEEFMPALTDRQKAANDLRSFEIKPGQDDSPGRIGCAERRSVRDWETWRINGACPDSGLLEERAALEPVPKSKAGSLPALRLGSGLPVRSRPSKVEVCSRRTGLSSMEKRVRCRSCDRSFSPSGGGIGTCRWKRSLSPKARRGWPARRDAVVRQRRPRDQHRLGDQP